MCLLDQLVASGKQFDTDEIRQVELVDGGERVESMSDDLNLVPAPISTADVVDPLPVLEVGDEGEATISDGSCELKSSLRPLELDVTSRHD